MGKRFRLVRNRSVGTVRAICLKSKMERTDKTLSGRSRLMQRSRGEEWGKTSAAQTAATIGQERTKLRSYRSPSEQHRNSLPKVVYQSSWKIHSMQYAQCYSAILSTCQETDNLQVVLTWASLSMTASPHEQSLPINLHQDASHFQQENQPDPGKQGTRNNRISVV